MKQRVIQVTQSPMNAQKWLLTLACKHEVWITSKSRPRRVTVNCTVCAEAVKPSR